MKSRFITLRPFLVAGLLSLAVSARADGHFCEYMQTKGSAVTYIDTGYRPTSNTVVRFKGRFNQFVSYMRLFSAYKDETTSATRLILTASDNGSIYCACWQPANLSILLTDAQRLAVGQDLEGEIGFLRARVNGLEVTGTGATIGSEQPDPVVLFSTTSANNAARLYYIQFYEHGHLVRSFVPYVQDGVNGFYETCTKGFYPVNSGGVLETGPAASLLQVSHVAPESDETKLNFPAYGYGLGVHVVTPGEQVVLTAPDAVTNAAGDAIYAPASSVVGGAVVKGARAEMTVVDGLNTLEWTWTPDQVLQWKNVRGISGYEVEYVDSAFGAYVDTGLKRNDTYEYRFKCRLLNAVTNDWAHGFWGTPGTDDQLKDMMVTGAMSSGSNFGTAFWHNSKSYGGATLINGHMGSSGYTAMMTGVLNADTVVMTNAAGVASSATVQHASAGALPNDNTILLFSTYRYPASARTHQRVRFYYFQVYDRATGKFVRDYVPVVTSKGEAGLLDRVTGQFFGNVSAAEYGRLSAGPLVACGSFAVVRNGFVLFAR